MNILKAVWLRIITLFLFSLIIPNAALADSLDTWHVRNSVPGGYTLNAVAYGNGIFVAVGSGGTILSSPDGTTWTPQASGTSVELSGVAFGNGLFVAVGSQGSILTSPDGTMWTPRSSGKTSSLGSIAYGNGIFVVSGASTLTSQDGLQWTIRGWGWNWLKFGDGKFVAFAYPGPPGIYESIDGITWIFKPRSDGIGGYFMDIVLHNGTYVIVGLVGTFSISPVPANEDIYTSPDGTNWTQTHHSDGLLNGRSFWINGINYGNGNIVAASSAGRIFHSPDGYGWTFAQTPSTDWLYGVAYGSRTFVAVGENGMIVQSDPLIETVGVPTLSEWGMMLLVLFCGLFAVRSLQATSR